MNRDPFHNYIEETAPVLCFRLGKTGCIETMNRYAREVCGPASLGKAFTEIIIDFNGSFDIDRLVADAFDRHLFNISTASGYPQSYLFSFRTIDSGTLVLAHLDTRDVERMRTEIVQLNQELGNLNRQLHKKNTALQYALDHVKTLQGIIPICMYCHKIRGEKQIWDQLEAYLMEHTEAELSHAICPACMDKYYPEEKEEPCSLPKGEAESSRRRNGLKP